MPPGPFPKYVNVPGCFIFCNKVPPVIRDTFYQLYGLAWNKGYRRTEPYLIKDLSDMLGKSPDTIWQHMRELSFVGWLRFIQAGYSTYIFEFPAQEELPSLFPEYFGSVVIKESPDDNNDQNQEDKRLVNNTSPRKSGNDDKKRDPNLDNPAVILYRGFSHLTANAYQRQLIANAVTDMDLWKQTLEHYFGHGWRPMDVSRIIASYKTGGEAGCTLCHPQKLNGNGNGPKTTAQDERKASLQALRERIANGNSR